MSSLNVYAIIQQVPGTAANAERAMEGDAPDEEKPMPDVPPPDFINCCKAVLLNFGNLNIDDEQGDLSVKIKRIASEAEVVATRIYGKGMTAREQQVSTTRAWHRRYSYFQSVFELRTHKVYTVYLTLSQDRAWKEQTTSIFDLETLEIEAERRGETAPWANPDGGDELFPGFGPDGKMQVGGT